MIKALIDFESFYDTKTGVSVVDLGNPNYYRAADAYIGAVLLGDEAICGTLKEIGPTMEQIAADPNVQCWAANSNFDQGWAEKYGWKTQRPWNCVLDLGAYHQHPRNLASLAKVVLNETVDKSVRDEMDGVTYESLDEAGQVRVQNYCLGDVMTMHRLIETLPPMSAVEERVAAHTRLMNRRGVHINLDLVATDKTKLETFRFEQFNRIPWRNDSKPLSYPALAKWCASRDLPVPKSTAKTDEECSDMMSENPQLNEVLTSMRLYRRANTELKKVESLLARTCDGVLPMDLMYCGAPHTRRWSSRGFNVQNLAKEPFQLGPIGSVWSRNWLIPPPGKKFLILDLAQIQPRALNWAAGNTEMMEALKSGFSYYEAYCRAAKPKVAEGWDGKAGTLKEFLGKAKYTKVKNESLGLGFGMGAEKYTTYAGVELDEAKLVVGGFRSRNKLVVDLWASFDKMIAAAARDKSKHFVLEMPTGDTLQYFGVRASGRGYEGFVIKGDFGHQSKQPRLWGGTMAENIAQRIERDIIAEAQLRLEDAGFPVIFNSHDEIICAVDENAGDDVKQECERLMTVSPAWAKDLPLGSEGDFAPCYTK